MVLKEPFYAVLIEWNGPLPYRLRLDGVFLRANDLPPKLCQADGSDESNSAETEDSYREFVVVCHVCPF